MLRTCFRNAALILILAASPALAADRIRIVAATTDLGSVAAAVGGDRVEIVSIARPTADPHRVEVLPSYMVRVSRARLYLKVGLGLDQWSDQIVDGSHNPDVQVIDCSAGIPVLEKPTGPVNASMGDVHPDGNPHYWLDPRNGGIVARTIADALGKVDPAGAEQYTARAEQFARDCDAAWQRGQATLGTLPVKSIFTYHKSWSYFAAAFGLQVAATAEPVPGIPPTARHLEDLVTLAKEQKIGVLLQEPYFSDDAGQFLGREGGVKVVKMSPSCDDVTPGSYLAHFDSLYAALKAG